MDTSYLHATPERITEMYSKLFTMRFPEISEKVGLRAGRASKILSTALSIARTEDRLIYDVRSDSRPHVFHRVNLANNSCTCEDARKGNLCKHVLALKFHVNGANWIQEYQSNYVKNIQPKLFSKEHHPMTQQPPAKPSPNPETLATLRAIQAASEATVTSLEALRSEIHFLTEITQNNIDAQAEFTKVLQASFTKSADAQQAIHTPNGLVVDFLAERITVASDEKGNPIYKIYGHPYTKWGVRVWPEVLPALGLHTNDLKPGDNPLPSLTVRAKLVDGKNGKTPSKVIGLGDGSAPFPERSQANDNNNQPAPGPDDLPF